MISTAHPMASWFLLLVDQTHVSRIRQIHPCDFDSGNVVVFTDLEESLGVFYDDGGNFLGITEIIP